MSDAIREECREKLQELCKKEYVGFTDTFENALLLCLRFAKENGFSTILVPDQGSLIPVQELLEKLDMTAVLLPTKQGLVQQAQLKPYTRMVVFMDSMPSFATLIDMEPISGICTTNELLLINNVTGSIGTRQAMFGDIVLCSLDYVPVDMEKGAFVAGNNVFREFYKKVNRTAPLEEDILYAAISRIDSTREHLLKKSRQVKKDLSRFEIRHRFGDGWNVLIEADEKEREMIIKYCDQHNLSYKLCPLRERMLSGGVSIELVR